MHPGVDNVTNRQIHIVGAQLLEKLDHFVSGGPEIKLGKGGVVAHRDSLTGSIEFLLDLLKPGRLVERLCLGNADSPVKSQCDIENKVFEPF